MNRRNFLAVLATPALIELLSACGSSSPNQSTPVSGPAVLASKKARVIAELDQIGGASAALNAFGSDMYAQLAAMTANENLVFSPASIMLALAMARAGAMGATATEMDTVLHLDSLLNAPRALNALASNLDLRNIELPADEGEPVQVQLAIVNSLWVQRDLALEQAFLDVLATEYGSQAHTVDYKTDPSGARGLINKWVSDNTNERIPELIQDGSITPDTRLSLVNAVYMKAPWARTFAKDATTTHDFTTAAKSSVPAQTMSLTNRFAYTETDNAQVIELPYAGGELSMLIVLPQLDVPIAAAVAALTEVELANMVQSTVDLRLPKFDIETATGLRDVLVGMGMPTAFGYQADFSGMTKMEKLLIASVIHQANITVDEDGTEAAAATAVLMEATAAPAPQEPVVMHVNRPFLFAILDKPSGAILFMGHIGDPNKTRG